MDSSDSRVVTQNINRMSLNCSQERCDSRRWTGRWKGKGGVRREKAEGREMLDNGIKLGLRDIDTELGIAILCGDHGYV